MKRDSRRLDLVQRVFAKREQEHALKLGDFQNNLNDAKDILVQLRAYRDQYIASAKNAGSTTTNLLLNQQAFQNRLSEAIAQQEHLIARARLERDELRRQWLKQRCRTESVGNLRTQRELAEQHEETQKEQKLLDEVAARTLGRLTE